MSVAIQQNCTDLLGGTPLNPGTHCDGGSVRIYQTKIVCELCEDYSTGALDCTIGGNKLTQSDQH